MSSCCLSGQMTTMTSPGQHCPYHTRAKLKVGSLRAVYLTRKVRLSSFCNSPLASEQCCAYCLGSWNTSQWSGRSGAHLPGAGIIIKNRGDHCRIIKSILSQLSFQVNLSKFPRPEHQGWFLDSLLTLLAPATNSLWRTRGSAYKGELRS